MPVPEISGRAQSDKNEGETSMNTLRSQTTEAGVPIRAGGIYFTFCGDYDRPYCFAKLLKTDDRSVWIKLYHENYAERPPHGPVGEWSTLHVSIDMFLAWGPPKFPIFVNDEDVTDNELAECIEDDPMPMAERLQGGRQN